MEQKVKGEAIKGKSEKDKNAPYLKNSDVNFFKGVDLWRRLLLQEQVDLLEEL